MHVRREPHTTWLPCSCPHSPLCRVRIDRPSMTASSCLCTTTCTRSLLVMFAGRLTYQLTFPLYLADSQAPPSSPTPSSRTYDQLGPSRVTPHLPSFSRTCSLVSEPVSSVHPAVLLHLHRHANDVCQTLSHLWPTLHAPTCQCVAPTLAPHALCRTARSSCLLPRVHASGHSQPVAAPDDRTRANSHDVAISACTPNHPPAPLDRSSAHAEVPCLVSLGCPSVSVRCDAWKTAMDAPSFPLSHKKRNHHHHSHL
jgi:hypothetical protein